MFTGIIREIGTVNGIKPKGATRRLSVRAGSLSKEAKIGDSISVDGVCLTVVSKSRDILQFDVMTETFNNTTLSIIKENDKLNLEPSLRLEEGISGHLVSGHIDEIGKIRKITRHGQGVMQLMVEVSPKAAPLLVKKGSVAVNGISLTVNGIGKDFFIVDIIPHTFKATTLEGKRMEDRVNIEFDMIGKYALQKLSMLNKSEINEDFLEKHGFM